MNCLTQQYVTAEYLYSVHASLLMENSTGNHDICRERSYTVHKQLLMDTLNATDVLADLVTHGILNGWLHFMTLGNAHH